MRHEKFLLRAVSLIALCALTFNIADDFPSAGDRLWLMACKAGLVVVFFRLTLGLSDSREPFTFRAMVFVTVALIVVTTSFLVFARSRIQNVEEFIASCIALSVLQLVILKLLPARVDQNGGDALPQTSRSITRSMLVCAISIGVAGILIRHSWRQASGILNLEFGGWEVSEVAFSTVSVLGSHSLFRESRASHTRCVLLSGVFLAVIATSGLSLHSLQLAPGDTRSISCCSAWELLGVISLAVVANTALPLGRPTFSTTPGVSPFVVDSAIAGSAVLASLTFAGVLDDTRLMTLTYYRKDELAELEWITFGQDTTDHDLAQFWPLVSHAKHVSLRESSITDHGLASICGAEIVSLDLSKTRISDQCFRYLAKLRHLKHLKLSETNVNGRGFENIGQANIRTLDLSGCPVDDLGLREICRLQLVEELNCSDTRVTDRGVVNLCDLQKLTTLSLAGAPVTGSGFSKQLNALTSLDMSRCPITDGCLCFLRFTPSIEVLVLRQIDFCRDGQTCELHLRIRSLDLSHSNLRDGQLPSALYCKTLREVSLVGTNLNDTGLSRFALSADIGLLDLDYTDITTKGLVTLRDLLRLTEVGLCGTRIDNRGVRHLASFPSLQIVDIRETPVSGLGVRSLAVIKQLRLLFVTETPATRSAILALEKTLPNCETSR